MILEIIRILSLIILTKRILIKDKLLNILIRQKFPNGNAKASKYFHYIHLSDSDSFIRNLKPQTCQEFNIIKTEAYKRLKGV